MSADLFHGSWLSRGTGIGDCTAETPFDGTQDKLRMQSKEFFD